MAVQDNSTIPDPPESESCHQVEVSNMFDPKTKASDDGDPPLVIGAPLTEPTPKNVTATENCLFLDIYVPVSALAPNTPKFPVVVWIYGGAYAFGSKLQMDPLYTGHGIVESSGNKLIYVTGNYRMGAFGWLAGSDFAAAGGLPNTGLYDQRLLLEWVQEHIDKVNGDKTEVSAWGESAGGGSILHHLTRGDGKEDPLFKRAVIQSPAFQWLWDHNGTLNNAPAKFSELAGCGSTFNITCLRSISIDDFAQANQDLFRASKGSGVFPVGPSVDGTLVTKLPAAFFAEGANYICWKESSRLTYCVGRTNSHVESVVVSHVGDETSVFTPENFTTATAFDGFVSAFMPQDKLSAVKASIVAQYNCTSPPYSGDYYLCAQIMMRDSCFTCNTRQLYDAYRNQSAWMMEYVFPSPYSEDIAVHSADLLPTFINSETDVVALLEAFHVPNPGTAATIMKLLAPQYQAYLTSHALHGDPNTAKHAKAPTWTAATTAADGIEPNLQVHYKLWAAQHFFDNGVSDAQNTREICGFWAEVAQNITRLTAEADGARGSLVAQKPEL